MANFDLESNTILLTLSGSWAYGLQREDSDIDVSGIAIPPRSDRESLRKDWSQDDGHELEPFFFNHLVDRNHSQAGRQNGCEGTIYNLKKFIALALKSNPTIWNALFCRESEVLYLTKTGETLRANRDLFLSRQAQHSFIGYAISQLQRIKRHKKWLDNPPTKPSREEMGLPVGGGILNKEQVNAFNTMSEDKLRELGISEKLIEIIQAEKQFFRAMEVWKQFETWRKNRNPARAKLEANAGYDTKHAMHLVRLLKMGQEILQTNRVNVWREDRDLLLAIRDGAWDYDTIIRRAEEMVQETELLAKSSNLPSKPNYEQVNDLYKELVRVHDKG